MYIYIYILIGRHDLWHVTHETWRVRCEMWHMTCDTGWGWILSQNVSSLALTVWQRQCFEKGNLLFSYLELVKTYWPWNMDPDFAIGVKCTIFLLNRVLGVHFDLYIEDCIKSKKVKKNCFAALPHTNPNIPSNFYWIKIWCISLQ